MRQGKLSELIHNSANYPDLDDCRVEVHFREIIDLVRRFDSCIEIFAKKKKKFSPDQMRLPL
jgi:hypothetical protein